MAQEIDIQKIIKHFNLDYDEVANALFPHIRYSRVAMNRVVRENLPLDTKQLQIIADLAGVFVQDLFSIEDWKGRMEDNCLTFLKGEYKAKLNYNGAWLSIYKNHELLAQEVFTLGLTLDEFLNHINDIIQNYNNKNGNN